jgi:hypothetical protein
VSGTFRVRRVRKNGIGVSIWGGTENVITDAAAADLACALIAEVNHKTPIADAALPSGRPLSDAAKDLIRQAVRPEAAFGKPFTVYGSAGPYRPTNPEDDGA